MNLVYGCATISAQNKYFQLLSGEVERNYSAKVELSQEKISNIQCGYISDDGVVLGCVKLDHLSLLYLGTLQKPLPDWRGGSPLDTPNHTAQYLLLRYQKYGLKFLDNIFGQYSVVICDRKENKLIIGCDPSGASTLYFTEIDRSLVFSSNLYCFVSALKERITLDRSYEDFFLIYGFMPWNKTFFKDVQCLSGSILEWHNGNLKINSINRSDPWQHRFPAIDVDQTNEDEAIELMYEAFMQATKDQLGSTQSAAVLLGGFDSALVASALSRLGKKVETFSFFYDDSQFNQAHTDTLADYLNIKHNWIPITKEIIRDGLQSYSLKFNKPTNWPNYVIQTEYLCSEIRKAGFLHCYTGDGCDGVFLGYPRTHTMAKFYQSSIRIPQLILKLMLYIAQWSVFEYALGRPYRIALNILRNLGRAMPMRGYLNFRVFDEISLNHLRTDLAPEQELSVEEILRELTKKLCELTPDRLAYHGKAAASANKSKMLGSSHSVGITITSPYLHPGLDALAKQLPDQLCRPNKDTVTAVTGKYILMKMAEKKKLLPKEIIHQRKISAVEAPIDDWYFGPLKNYVMEVVQGLPFDYNELYIRNLLRPKLAEKYYKSFISSDHLTTHGISLLATYASFTKALKK